MVLGRGLGVAVIGVAVAMVAFMPMAAALQPLLFEVRAISPGIVAAVSLLVLLVSAAAVSLPAWRAASVNPADALRAE